jgi:hypothetical protein
MSDEKLNMQVKKVATEGSSGLVEAAARALTEGTLAYCCALRQL